jgi:uncharacterized protein YbcI
MHNTDSSNDSALPMAEQIAKVATAFHVSSTGHLPTAVNVTTSGNLLVVALHGALSTAELAMTETPDGQAKVDEFHRQLFKSASGPLQHDIKRITGMRVLGDTCQLQPTCVHLHQSLSNGTLVEIFTLSGNLPCECFHSEFHPSSL